MTSVLKKCKEHATFIHKSDVAKDQLARECRKNDHSATVINQNNDTRWDSQLACMSSVLTHQPCLENLARGGIDRFPELLPSISDFLLIKGACENLKKCKVTTKIFEQEKVPTINLVVDRIFTVLEEMDAFIQDRNDRGSGVMFARNLKIEIENRFPEYATCC